MRQQKRCLRVSFHYMAKIIQERLFTQKKIYIYKTIHTYKTTIIPECTADARTRLQILGKQLLWFFMLSYVENTLIYREIKKVIWILKKEKKNTLLFFK